MVDHRDLGEVADHGEADGDPVAFAGVFRRVIDKVRHDLAKPIGVGRDEDRRRAESEREPLAAPGDLVATALDSVALKRIDASKLAVFSNGQPIVAAILSVIFFEYTITGNFVAGAIITIAGVILTQLG